MPSKGPTPISNRMIFMRRGETCGSVCLMAITRTAVSGLAAYLLLTGEVFPDEPFMAPQDSSDSNQAPIVIKQGGNGLGIIIAALILVGGAVYVVNVWSDQQRSAPAEAQKVIKDGVTSLQESARQGIDAIKNKAN